ncbi:hypothetical protein BDFB_001827 [Asbolus verrucosus]|uniref:Uncharacterized protein n=1 Tax=Asbolus verrucosus TaxID=1661398 RepID=A0A482VMM8_ASBVE|nr:hypothetical protein BDFB_001827 [Asbolus verrucosus]
MTSYVPKKNHAVVLLFNQHNNKISDEDNLYKSTIILDFNHSKGVVDTMDKMSMEKEKVV